MAVIKNQELRYQFGENSNTMDWYVVNDGVMGGLSKSIIEYSSNTLRFSGEVSLENNGGFASIRSPFKNYDLSSYEKVEIKYKSTKQDVAFVLAPYRRWYYPNYKVLLPATNNEWNTIEFDVKEFREYEIGRATGNLIDSNILGNIIRLGLITQTKAAGLFTFEIEYIQFS